MIDDFLTESICGRVAAVARIAVNLLLSESIRGRFDEVNFCKSLRLKLGMFGFLFFLGVVQRAVACVFVLEVVCVCTLILIVVLVGVVLFVWYKGKAC